MTNLRGIPAKYMVLSISQNVRAFIFYNGSIEMEFTLTGEDGKQYHRIFPLTDIEMDALVFARADAKRLGMKYDKIDNPNFSCYTDTA